MTNIRVAVNGYGVIGKRVADAVKAMPDMELVGVADVATDWRVRTSIGHDIPVFAATEEAEAAMRAAEVPLAGRLEDLLGQVDAVVDTTPKGVAATNLDRYRDHRSFLCRPGELRHGPGPGHYQGGLVQHHEHRPGARRAARRKAPCSRPRGPDSARHRPGGVPSRRDNEHGRARAVHPLPSGPDARTVLPDLDVVTMAAMAAHTQSHNHYWTLQLTRTASRDEVLDALRAAPRLAFIRMADGLVALNTTVELMRDLGRPRGDMWEVALWEDVLTVEGDEAYLNYQVYNEAIVVPESIDAIRALTGSVTDGATSIAMTDAALGMRQEFLPAPAAVRG